MSPPHVDRGAALGRVAAVGETRNRHVDERRIGGRGLAVGKGDLQHLGKQVQRVGGAESYAAHVESLQDFQHLHDMDPARGRRRRPDDFVVAVGAVNHCTVDDAIAAEVVHGDEAATPRHVVDERTSEGAVVQETRPFLRDRREGVGVGTLDQPGAGGDRPTIRHEQSGDLGITGEIGGALAGAFVQIGGDAKAARRVTNCRFEHVGERKGAEPRQGVAPRLEGARHGHRGGTDGVPPAERVHRPRRRGRVGVERLRPGRQRCGAQAVDHDVASVGETQMRDPASRDADHHRLDHGQGEESRDGGVDRIAACGQHLDAGRGRQRMIGDDHPARALGRLLLAGKKRARSFTPSGLAHACSPAGGGQVRQPA